MKDEDDVSLFYLSLPFIYATVFSIGSFLRIPENLNADTIIISAICINIVLHIFIFKNTRINLIHADKTSFVKDFVILFTPYLIFFLVGLLILPSYLEKTVLYEIYDQPIPELFTMSWVTFLMSSTVITFFFEFFTFIFFILKRKIKSIYQKF